MCEFLCVVGTCSLQAHVGSVPVWLPGRGCSVAARPSASNSAAVGPVFLYGFLGGVVRWLRARARVCPIFGVWGLSEIRCVGPAVFISEWFSRTVRRR